MSSIGKLSVSKIYGIGHGIVFLGCFSNILRMCCSHQYTRGALLEEAICGTYVLLLRMAGCAVDMYPIHPSPASLGAMMWVFYVQIHAHFMP